ncbi:hypothetical protein [endosymbiont of Riftia pachyptila]|uniref:hypothetical protein n=1 Tax=endosymbiont of Riftia pachyptila TaxID=54396 RepID=UPI0011129BBA|nr:hypothetical protein [endosymbiont of Riftia pachyptila]
MQFSLGFRGGPSSAFLEVLDGEPIPTFHSGYVAVAFDLSDVLFVSASTGLFLGAALLVRLVVLCLFVWCGDALV